MSKFVELPIVMKGIPFDTDALAFTEAVGLTESRQQIIVNNLVKDLKNTGVWSKLTAVYPFIGGNANAHSYNLINPEKYRFTWGNQAEHSALGVVPRTQAHYNNLPLSDISANAGNDVSVHMYIDDKSNANLNAVDVYSTVASGLKSLTVYLSTLNKTLRFDCGTSNSNANVLQLTNVNVTGLMSFTSAENKLTAYRNGVHIGERTHTPADIQSLIVRFNYDNATVDNRKHYSFLSWGKGLTSNDVSSLNEVIQKYQAKLNRSVVS